MKKYFIHKNYQKIEVSRKDYLQHLFKSHGVPVLRKASKLYIVDFYTLHGIPHKETLNVTTWSTKQALDYLGY